MMSTVTVKTSCGIVEGMNENGVNLYKGIRYATASRWSYPQEVTHWDGIYRAEEYGDSCPQRRQWSPEKDGSFYYEEFRKDVKFTYSEDCLNLNLWVPEHAKNAPVILCIHGGAFMAGCGNENQFDGTEYAKHGVIFATCNYRLGPLGFISLPELEQRDGHTGNYGLYDQYTAIKWLVHNIASFGGNPERIILMGQSAGAMSIQWLCNSELVKPFISGAVMTSGGGGGSEFGTTASHDEAISFWNSVKRKLGSSLDEWLQVSPENLTNAMFQAFGTVKDPLRFTGPVIDGGIVPCSSTEEVTAGLQAEIPYMMGTMANDLAPKEMYTMAKRWCVQQSIQNKIPSYCFYFERKLPGDDHGSWHSCDLWYTMGNFTKCHRPMTAYDKKISDTMISYIAQFAFNGNPNKDGLPIWNSTTTEQDHVLDINDQDIKMAEVNPTEDPAML